MSQKYQLAEALLDGDRIYGVVITCGSGDVYTYKYVSRSEKETKQLIFQMSADDDIAPEHFDDIVKDFIIRNAYHIIECNGI